MCAYYTIREVATRLGITRNSVLRLIQRGTLRAVILPGATLRTQRVIPAPILQEYEQRRNTQS